MATGAEFKVILTIDSQGNAKIEEVKRALEGVGEAAAKSSKKGADGANEFASAMMRKLGVMALVTAGLWKLEQAAVGAFKAGIQAVDDFKLSTIGVAATITDMAVDQSKGQENFNQALAYSQGMYNELELAAARYFASGKDMTQAWNILAQKGIVLKHEEIDALGIIVDRIKLSTQGQVAALQIAQEMRSMITGQARATDQVGMLLKDRVPNLEAELQKHRQIGDVVTWLASQFKGLEFANGKIQETLESQYSTLGTLATQVGRGGLTGAYQDIVDLTSQINEYLTTHKDDLMVGIAKGWTTIAWTIKQAADAAERVNKAASIEMPNKPQDRTLSQSAAAGFKEAFDPLNWANVLLVSTKFLWDGIWESTERAGQSYMRLARQTDMLFKETGKVSDLITNSDFWKFAIDTEGPKRELDDIKGKIQWVIDLLAKPYNFVINAVVTGLPSWLGGGSPASGAMPERKLTIPDTSLAAAQEQARLKALGKSQIMTPDFGLLELPDWAMQSSTPPKTKKPGGDDKTGGGGKGRDTTDTLENLILQLRQEEAKLEDGAFGGIDAWYTKITEKIKNLAMDDKQLKDGMLAASELKSAKEEKVSADLNKWYLGQMHQTTAAQLAEDEKKLASVKGHAAEEGKVREVMAQHSQERSDKLALAENQQQKAYYDSLASSSILIKDQVAWKEQSWQIEKKISQVQLEQWFISKDLSAADEDNYRGLQALTNAAKDYNQQRQKAVDLGTLEGWAIERAGDSLKRSRSTIKDALTGVENYVTDAWTQGIEGALTKTKKDWKEVGQTVVQSMILELNKKSFTKIWDNIAKTLAPQAKKTTGDNSADTAEQLSVAAGGLQEASIGFNLNTAQFGLAAGGLLLSGIGIATNSQALVYAGAFLQVIALAIQVYEMLTATTTTSQFTMSAVALTTSAAFLKSSATALIAAARALASSASKGGGGGIGGILGGALSFIPGVGPLLGAAVSIGGGMIESGLLGHSGLLVAHDGLLVAHNGLQPDERLVKVLTGEPILRREAMAAYTDMGMSFDDLNNGRLPVQPVAVPYAGGSSRGGTPERFQATMPVTVILKSPEGRELSRRQERQVVTLVRKYKEYREL